MVTSRPQNSTLPVIQASGSPVRRRSTSPSSASRVAGGGFQQLRGLLVGGDEAVAHHQMLAVRQSPRPTMIAAALVASIFAGTPVAGPVRRDAHPRERRLRRHADRARPGPDRRALRPGRRPGQAQRPLRRAPPRLARCDLPADATGCSRPRSRPRTRVASGSLDDIAVILLREPVRDIAPLPTASAPVVGEPSLTIGRGPHRPGPSGPSAVPLGASQVVSDGCAAPPTARSSSIPTATSARSTRRRPPRRPARATAAGR